jgi:predicted O-linked N-acetylglucosamine transferase (SPINDLY family)
MQSQLDKAAASYLQAVSLWPAYADAHTNLGIVLDMLGNTQRAIHHYHIALGLKPASAETHNNLGSAYTRLNMSHEAIKCYRQSIAIKSGDPEPHRNLGLELARLGNIDEAITCYETALKLKPGHGDAHNDLGLALLRQGRADRAAAHFKKSTALRADLPGIHSNYLLAINYLPQLDRKTVYEAHREFEKRWVPPPGVLQTAHRNTPTTDRRLRIGYVSADLREHSVASFIVPVIERHDHERFEIYCYYNYPTEDDVTRNIRSYSDRWTNISGLTDDQVAEGVAGDAIDILVDLNGHTALNRMPVFARKPAPVQVTWLGYPNTTGLSAIDYRITDAYTDPVGASDVFHSEKLVRLPDCFSCFAAPSDAPEVVDPPVVSTGLVTFASFNSFAKISPDLIQTWAKILAAVPGSRLLIKSFGSGHGRMQESIREILAIHGVASDRLQVLDYEASRRAHLACYNVVDIALDTFPYNGTTTTCEALWMGVPVVSLAGETHAARVSAGLLRHLDLPALIATTPAEYAAIAVRLSETPAQINALRHSLRGRMRNSPLLDAQRFTANLEALYADIWSAWCEEHARQSG